MLQSKSRDLSTKPLYIIVYRPREGACYVYSIYYTRGEDVIEVGLEVVCSTQVPENFCEGSAFALAGFYEAEFGDYDVWDGRVEGFGYGIQELADSGWVGPEPGGGGGG